MYKSPNENHNICHICMFIFTYWYVCSLCIYSICMYLVSVHLFVFISMYVHLQIRPSIYLATYPICFVCLVATHPCRAHYETQHCSAVARPWLSTLPKSKRKRRSSALRHHEAQGVHGATSNHGTSSDQMPGPARPNCFIRWMEAAICVRAPACGPATQALGQDLHWNLVTLVVRRIMMALLGAVQRESLVIHNMTTCSSNQFESHQISWHLLAHWMLHMSFYTEEQWQKGCALVAMTHPFQITSQYLQRGPRIHEQIKYDQILFW